MPFCILRGENNYEKGIVYRSSGGPLRYQGWASVDIDENGMLYAAWSGGRVAHICPFGVNYLSKSRDGGQSWSCPTAPCSPPCATMIRYIAVSMSLKKKCKLPMGSLLQIL